MKREMGKRKFSDKMSKSQDRNEEQENVVEYDRRQAIPGACILQHWQIL